jgi:hypothetical protein
MRFHHREFNDCTILRRRIRHHGVLPGWSTLGQRNAIFGNAVFGSAVSDNAVFDNAVFDNAVFDNAVSDNAAARCETRCGSS